MTELKTINDMGEDECGFGNQHIDRRELKAEAVKRWKYFKMCWNNSRGANQCSYLQGKMDELKDNFNITEEDLKEAEK